MLCLCVLASVACTPARRKVETDIVRDVHFQGNGGLVSGHNDYQVRLDMGQRATALGLLIWPLTYWVTPYTLSLDALHDDALRMEVWYAHRGWFDAQWLGWEVRRVRKARGKDAGVVDIIGHVEPGPRSVVRRFEILGLKGGLGSIERLVGRTGDVVVGEPFSLAAVYATRTALLSQLHDHAHAYSKAEVGIDAFPERQEVDVTLAVEPGIPSVFGPVEIGGVNKIKPKFVQDTLMFEPGHPYKLAKLRDTQRALFDLGLFSLVSLQPDLSDPTNEEVPIRVHVTESRFRTFRVGLGGEYNGFQLSPRLLMTFDDVYMFGSLLHLKTGGSAGFTVAVQEIDQNPEIVPLYDVFFDLSYPWLAKRKLAISASLSVEQDLQSGQFLYQQIETSLSVTARPHRDVAITFGPHWEQLHYADAGPFDAFKEVHGDGLRSLYRLWAFDAGFAVDKRDDPISTTRGYYLDFGVRQSIPVVADDYLFSRFSAEVRGFRPIRFSKTGGFPLILAGRLQGTIVQPWQGSAVPYPELAFMGGSNSLRGFRANQVGPYDALCVYPDDGGTPRLKSLPRGGQIAVEATPEVRIKAGYGFSVAAWGEGGLLLRDWNSDVVDGLRYGGGVGLRYASPVGPIRLDIGMRPLFPEDAGPATRLQCDPGDELHRAFDLYAAGASKHPPLAINLFLAIGEAF